MRLNNDSLHTRRRLVAAKLRLRQKLVVQKQWRMIMLVSLHQPFGARKRYQLFGESFISSPMHRKPLLRIN
jgi:hypothetical protein